jgi:hypothetical protein
MHEFLGKEAQAYEMKKRCLELEYVNLIVRHFLQFSP